MKNSIQIPAKLIREVRNGNRSAFHDLTESLMKPAYFHALAIVGNHEDAVDISQETFIRVWKNRKKMDPDRPFYPWFYTILKRLCLNSSRDRLRRKESVLSELPDWIEFKSNSNPGDDIIRSEEKNLIREALSVMKPDDREIIVLKDLQDYSYREIAEMLAIPAGTVMSRLYTARRKLKSNMEEAGYEYY